MHEHGPLHAERAVESGEKRERFDPLLELAQLVFRPGGSLQSLVKASDRDFMEREMDEVADERRLSTHLIRQTDQVLDVGGGELGVAAKEGALRPGRQQLGNLEEWTKLRYDHRIPILVAKVEMSRGLADGLREGVQLRRDGLAIVEDPPGPVGLLREIVELRERLDAKIPRAHHLFFHGLRRMDGREREPVHEQRRIEVVVFPVPCFLDESEDKGIVRKSERRISSLDRSERFDVEALPFRRDLLGMFLERLLRPMVVEGNRDKRQERNEETGQQGIAAAGQPASRGRRRRWDGRHGCEGTRKRRDCRAASEFRGSPERPARGTERRFDFRLAERAARPYPCLAATAPHTHPPTPTSSPKPAHPTNLSKSRRMRKSMNSLPSTRPFEAQG